MDFLLKCFNVLNEGFQGCVFLCLLLIIVYLVYLFILLVFVFTVSISSLFIIRKTLKSTTKHLQTSNEYSKTLNHKLSNWRPNLESIQDFICKYYKISHHWCRAFRLWLRCLDWRLVHTLLSLTILLFVRTYQRLWIWIFPFLLKD